MQPRLALPAHCSAIVHAALVAARSVSLAVVTAQCTVGAAPVVQRMQPLFSRSWCIAPQLPMQRSCRLRTRSLRCARRLLRLPVRRMAVCRRQHAQTLFRLVCQLARRLHLRFGRSARRRGRLGPGRARLVTRLAASVTHATLASSAPLAVDAPTRPPPSRSWATGGASSSSDLAGSASCPLFTRVCRLAPAARQSCG